MKSVKCFGIVILLCVWLMMSATQAGAYPTWWDSADFATQGTYWQASPFPNTDYIWDFTLSIQLNNEAVPDATKEVYIELIWQAAFLQVAMANITWTHADGSQTPEQLTKSLFPFDPPTGALYYASETPQPQAELAEFHFLVQGIVLDQPPDPYAPSPFEGVVIDYDMRSKCFVDEQPVIPEPTTILMLGTGLIALVGICRKLKK